jgi:hypothetical protein
MAERVYCGPVVGFATQRLEKVRRIESLESGPGSMG